MMLLQPRSWFCINYDGAAGDVDSGEDDLKDVGDYAWHQYSL